MKETLFPKTLQRVFDTFDITDPSDHSFMFIAFEAGKKDAFGESTQVPALCTSPNLSTPFGSFDGGIEFWPDLEEVATGPNLTPSEVDTLKFVCSSILAHIAEVRKESKEVQGTLYDMADKDTLIGQTAFRNLNAERNFERKLKAKEKKLATIVHKLKYSRD